MLSIVVRFLCNRIYVAFKDITTNNYTNIFQQFQIAISRHSHNCSNVSEKRKLCARYLCTGKLTILSGEF